MMGLRDFYCIRVNTRYLNEVINAHEALEKKGFIEFSSAGMFSASIDVVYENYFFEQELRKAGIPFSVRKVRSRYCLDPVIDFKEARVIRREIIRTLNEIFDESDTNAPLLVSETPLQIKEVPQKYVIEFTTEQGCTKDEFIKGIQKGLNKLPDNAVLGSFKVFGIATYGTRYEVEKGGKRDE